jgi:hypothetical protein
MAKRKPHIVQDERGQDQPTSKRAAHHTEPTMPKDALELDPRDIGDGLHDPLNDQERPQPHQVPLKTTRQDAAQPDTDAPPPPELSHSEPDLPEGLRRPRTGPYGPTRGRA